MTSAVVQCLPGAWRDAAKLATRLDVGVDEIEVHRFPDGELRITAGNAAPVTIVYAPLDNPNDKLITLMFVSEALRRTGAGRLVLVAPHICYMRQDTAFHAGESISQKVIGRLLASAFDRIITVDAHLHRTKTIRDVFPGIEADDLSAAPAIAEALKASPVSQRTIVVGPDEESEPWIMDLAKRIGCEYAVCLKQRRGDRSVSIAIGDPSRISGRDVLLVDDMASSGGTLIACAKALLEAGALQVDAIVTHALFPPSMIQAFMDAGIRGVRSCHSVVHLSNAFPLDRILAEALSDEVS